MWEPGQRSGELRMRQGNLHDRGLVVGDGERRRREGPEEEGVGIECGREWLGIYGRKWREGQGVVVVQWRFADVGVGGGGGDDVGSSSKPLIIV